MSHFFWFWAGRLGVLLRFGEREAGRAAAAF